MARKIECWHFVSAGRKLGYGSGIEVAPGYTYTEDGPIEICRSGLHGSRTVLHALGYAPGPVLCRVRIWGEVTERDDKLVGRNREVINVLDVSSALRLWACWCIRNTPIGDGRTVWDLLTDRRSRKAVEVAEAFASGGATKAQLMSAWNEAWAAVGDASRAAAEAAAWAAAEAASRAASSAASEAASSAASRAASSAASEAASSAASEAAAWAAAEQLHARELERRMRDLFGMGPGGAA